MSLEHTCVYSFTNSKGFESKIFQRKGSCTAAATRDYRKNIWYGFYRYREVQDVFWNNLNYFKNLSSENKRLCMEQDGYVFNEYVLIKNRIVAYVVD